MTCTNHPQVTLEVIGGLLQPCPVCVRELETKKEEEKKNEQCPNIKFGRKCDNTCSFCKIIM